MTFFEIVDQAVEELRRHKRLTYRALKMQFSLDQEQLEALKDEIVFGRKLGVDEDGRVLVWAEKTDAQAPAGPSSQAPVDPSLKEEDRAPLSYTPQHLAEKILTSRNALEGERKQVTVLFADIKGSLELSNSLDPEETDKLLLHPAQQVMLEAVHRYEGTVNQIMGDGIMALFGAPIAHEDHAARACYAALDIKSSMRRHAENLQRSHALNVQVRVGLNSGEVVVRTIGNDLRMDYTAIGRTTHLAARMEQLAAPDTILMTPATFRLVEGRVNVNSLGQIAVKGLPEPLETFELREATSVRGHFHATAARGLTRFVGRESQLEALSSSLKKAGDGRGQVLAVVGEAGVGKSRLIFEFIHSHHTEHWFVVESAGVSWGRKQTPYFPVVDLLKRYFQIQAGDETTAIESKVTERVRTLDPGMHEIIPPLLTILEALPVESPFRNLDPRERRERTIAALKHLLLRQSQETPLLLVFEDLHWIDNETQAFLDSLVDSLPEARIFLFVNYRHGYVHGWGSKTYYTEVRVDPLPPESADQLLRALLGDDTSVEPLKQLLIERTEGNPFFLEECVRTMVETAALAGTAGDYRLVKSLPAVQVPDTVQAVLAARIDRLLPEEKHLLQTAAVIGTELPVGLLRAIADLPESNLQSGLARLQAAKLVYQKRLYPELTFTFEHALTHEVAYGSLLRQRRRELHVKVVESLEATLGKRLADEVERLARHAFRGELWDKAVMYLRDAGAKAMLHSAFLEALTSYEQALEALSHVPESREKTEQAVDLRLDLRNVLFLRGDLARVGEYLREAQALAETLADRHRLARVLNFLCGYHGMAGDPECAVQVGEQALALEAANDDVALGVVTRYYMGVAYNKLGQYQSAMDILRRGIQSVGGDLRHERFGTTVVLSVIFRSHLVQCLAMTGHFREGVLHGEEGIRIAEEIEHTVSLIHCQCSLGVLYLLKGELDKAAPLLEGSLRLCQTANIPIYLAHTASPLGALYAASGRVHHAIPLLEQGVKNAGPGGRVSFLSLRMGWLSEAYLVSDRLEEAGALAERAFDLSKKHKERGHEAWALKLLGDVALRRNSAQPESAKTYYDRALEVSTELGMRPLQAHCHAAIADVDLKIGAIEEARSELSAAIDLYRSMDMTFWLPSAHSTLAKLTAKSAENAHS